MEMRIGLDAITSYRRLSYTPWHALAEFVDNSTQSFVNERSALESAFASEGDGLEVSITYDRAADLIRIADNAAGMDEGELQRALHVGLRPTNAAWRSKYGMGMKTAACWLGDQWTVVTKKLGGPREIRVEVDVQRIAQGDADVRETSPRDNLPRDTHYTVIEIRRLHRGFQGRTLGKIKDYMRSMYRQDFRDGTLALIWNGEKLAWDEIDGRLLLAPDGDKYKKTFAFVVDGKSVTGWVGVLASGSRANAGFSILHCGRVVRGWPDAWRPASLYGQIQGSNDLINQRLVGEIQLDGFDVSHTKDDILWVADQEERVEEELGTACWDYRETARKHRKGADQRGPSEIETETAVQELKKELSSNELVDAVRLEVVPDPPIVKATVQALIRSETAYEPTFRAEISGITMKLYLSRTKSENDPYFVADATRPEEVCVVVNRVHPHWNQLNGSEGVLNYLRHCVYDALAEHLARHKKATIEPDTIKMFKDKFLRVPFEIEVAESAADDVGDGAAE